MNQVTNNVALVIGGTGNVGEGIVRALLAEGAQVVVPSRSADRLTRLTHYVEDVPTGHLHTLLTDVSVPEQASQLRQDVLSQFGRLNIVVASLGGGWSQGTPLLTVPLTRWQAAIQGNLTNQLLVAQAFAPPLLTTTDSLYVQINGYSGVNPYPNAGAISIACAGLIMMGRQLAQENQASPTRFLQLVLGPINSRVRSRAQPDWYTPEEVGEYLVKVYTRQPAVSTDAIHYLLGRPTASA